LTLFDAKLLGDDLFNACLNVTHDALCGWLENGLPF
jgi:hypothetical protein